MRFTTAQLIKRQNHDNTFDETIDFSSVLKDDDDIFEIEPAHVQGYFEVEDQTYFHFHLNIQSALTMACAKSLKPVKVPIDIEVKETFSADKNDDNLNIEGLTIDLYPVIWSNIYLEKPMRVVHPDAKNLTFDDPVSTEEKVHPAFKDLAKYKK